MKFLLSVIAVCLLMITAKLYIPQVNAEVDGMDYRDLRRDRDFKKAVIYLIENDYDIENAIEDKIEDCNISVNESVYTYQSSNYINLSFTQNVNCY